MTRSKRSVSFKFVSDNIDFLNINFVNLEIYVSKRKMKPYEN